MKIAALFRRLSFHLERVAVAAAVVVAPVARAQESESGGFFGYLIDAMRDAVVAFFEFLAFMGQAMIDIGTAVLEWLWENVGAPIWDFWLVVVVGVSDFILAIYDAIIYFGGLIVDLAGAFWRGELTFFELIGRLWDILAAFFRSIFGALFGVLADIFTQFWNSLVELSQGVINVLYPFLEALGIVAIIDFLADWILFVGDILEFFWDSIILVLDFFVQNISLLWPLVIAMAIVLGRLFWGTLFRLARGTTLLPQLLGALLITAFAEAVLQGFRAVARAVTVFGLGMFVFLLVMLAVWNITLHWFFSILGNVVENGLVVLFNSLLTTGFLAAGIEDTNMEWARWAVDFVWYFVYAFAVLDIFAYSVYAVITRYIFQRFNLTIRLN